MSSSEEGRVGSDCLVAKLIARFGLHPVLRFSGAGTAEVVNLQRLRRSAKREQRALSPLENCPALFNAAKRQIAVAELCIGPYPAERVAPSVEIFHHHDPLVVEVQLRVQNGFSVGRYRQALNLTVKGRV